MADWMPPEAAKGWAPPEVSGGWKPPEVAGGGGRRLAGTAASAVDLLTGFAGMLIQLPIAAGAEITGAALSPWTGETSKEILQSGKRIGESVDPISGIATRAVKSLGGGRPEDFDQNVINKAMGKVAGVIQKGGEWTESKTEGVVPAEAFEQFTNALMLKVPGLTKDAAGWAAKKLVGERTAASKGTAAGILEKEGGKAPADPITTPPTDAEIGRLKKDLDQHRTAEEKAYDLMQRGASIKEVEKAIEKNPLVGDKLDALRARRAQAAEAFDRDFGARQGEVVPPETVAPKGPKGQRGGADPQLLVKLGLAGAGAVAGLNLADQDKLEAAILGGLGGVAAASLPRYAESLRENWRGTLASTAGVAAVGAGLTYLDRKHPVEGALLGALYGSTKMLPKAVVPKVGDMTIDELVNLRNGAVAVSERRVANLAWALRESVPDAGRRAELAAKLDRGDLSGLSKEELSAARAYRTFTDSYGEAAKDVGLVEDLVQNYVTHIVEREQLPKTKAQEVMQSLFGQEAGGPGGGAGRFAKHRKYATFGELQTALEGSGLRVKTMDLAEIAEIYGRSMGRAIENKRLVTNLKAAQAGDSPLIVPAEKALPGYVPVNSPQTRGMYVHPDLAPSLRFVLESRNPGEITKGMLALSLAQKRLATGLSLFHASNLLNAYAGAMGTDAFRFKSSIDAALKAYREGGAGDAIDYGLRNGLQVVKPIEADVNALRKLGALADSYVERATGVKAPVGEKVLGGIEKLQKETFDKITWDYLHQGMKLSVFLKKFEDGLRKNPRMDPNEVARQTASFVNDTFGGLDWYRVATETQTQLGRKAALSAFSPSGRTALQVLMFAPDWTMSTFRAMYKALPGATKMPLTAKLHQGYVMRTALIWATLMNGYNLATSGHPIWDNKDPTKIEWADGTTQQVAKHAMEGPEWLLNPRQTALNKLGFIPKELATQGLGVEYLSTHGKAPPIESRTGHLIAGVAPISAQQFKVPGRDLETAVRRSVLSAAGAPIYGMTAEEKLAAKREARRRRRQDLEDRRKGK